MVPQWHMGMVRGKRSAFNENLADDPAPVPFPASLCNRPGESLAIFMGSSGIYSGSHHEFVRQLAPCSQGPPPPSHPRRD